MLNIYGQENPHDTVIISGTREDLLGLCHAISEAAYFDNNSIDLFDSAGEEYQINISCKSEEEMQLRKPPSHYYGIDD